MPASSAAAIVTFDGACNAPGGDGDCKAVPSLRAKRAIQRGVAVLDCFVLRSCNDAGLAG